MTPSLFGALAQVVVWIVLGGWDLHLIGCLVGSLAGQSVWHGGHFMVQLVLRYDGNPTTTGTIAGISLPPLVYLINYKRLWPRSLRWKNKSKYCSGWFVVRAKHCSGWKNKLKNTDYKRSVQGIYHYNDNPSFRCQCHMCLLKEMSAFNYFVSKGNWVKEDRNREALPKGKLAAWAAWKHRSIEGPSYHVP